MAQFRTTADIVDSVLERCGEITNGNSAYESRALEFVNRIHRTLVAGGNEFNIEVDEAWDWAQPEKPLIMELLPKQNTGTLSMTKGSEAGTFSAGPTPSLAGWHIRQIGKDEIYKIASHTAGATAFELDGLWSDATDGTASFEAFKLDYELVGSHIIIDSKNNKLDFEETSASELTSTLTSGAYTPAALATEIDTQLTADGASAYTITYSAITRKFTLTSDLTGGGNTFKLLCQSGTNQATSAWATLGFDTEDEATTATHTSDYILNGIARLNDPITINRKGFGRGIIESVDENRFKQDYPLNTIPEGYPTKFHILHESNDGIVMIRFNKFPEKETRIELPYTAIPLDLKDNAQSIPLVPRKDVDVLELGASAELMYEKEDTKSSSMFERAGRKLMAMLIKHRNQLTRTGPKFGQVIPREDLMPGRRRRRLIYGVPEDA